jgi:hypothetical protein
MKKLLSTIVGLTIVATVALACMWLFFQIVSID